MDASRMREEAERLEEGVLHYEDSNRVAADGWRRWSQFLGFGAALAGAVTAAVNLDNDPNSTYAAISGVITGGLAASLAFFRPQERERANRSAAAELNLLRHALRRFRTLECGEPTANQERLHARLHELSQRRDELVARSTDYSPRAFDKARKRIEGGVFDYAADKTSSDG